MPNGNSSQTGQGQYGEGIVLRNLATDPSVVVSFNVIGGVNTNPGGLLAGGGNLISGNWDDGILMAGANVSANTVKGNYIGTDITGQNPLSNSNFGVLLTQITGQTGAPSANIIGTTDVGGAIGGGNLISGNGTAAEGTTPAIGGGIRIANGASANVVQNNRIGTDYSGQQPLVNDAGGVFISAANGNFIGGDDIHSPNVISDNVGNGISILNGASGNKVRGNLIGTDSTGAKFLPNSGDGVFISDSNGNFIGDDTSTGGPQNVISGNDGNGITIANGSGNYVEHNFIGTSLDESTPLPNLEGIALIAATGNYIGNVETENGQQVGLGNVISDNSTTGIAFSAQANSNFVFGNDIGTDLTGTLNRGNDDVGISINDSSGNQIGGTTAAARNLIVFNETDGIDIESVPINAQLPPNVIEGDYIGVGLNGTQPEGNTYNGILIDNSSSNTIGGSLVNVISDNGLDGVQIGQQSQSNTVAGNYIGTTADGNSPLPNGISTTPPDPDQFGSGIVITAGSSQNTIGGSTAGSNVISGNNVDGIYISNAGQKNKITNNYIGVNAAGTGPLTGTSPQHNGIVIDNTPGTIIGAASFAQGGNVVSGNQFDGIYVGGAASTGTQIDGNYIGTDKSGAVPMANGRSGVDLAAQSTFGFSGPSSQTTVSNNVISGNLQAGVALVGGTNGNHLQDNDIGTNSAQALIPDQGYGVYISNSPGNFVGIGDGGNTIYFTQVSNQIAAISGVGVFITGQASTGNNVDNNDIYGNATAGIEIAGGASGNRIGDTEGNTIGGSVNGIVISDSGTQDNTVEDNDVGIDFDDTVEGNTNDGILVTAGASFNTIGGASGEYNVISCNNNDGVEISGQGTSYNNVVGNYIGTDLAGNYKNGQQFGNGGGSTGTGDGIEISAPNNVIGGETEGAGNIIAGSLQGIAIDAPAATANVVVGNDIENNSGNGILITNGSPRTTASGVRTISTQTQFTTTGPTVSWSSPGRVTRSATTSSMETANWALPWTRGEMGTISSPPLCYPWPRKTASPVGFKPLPTRPTPSSFMKGKQLAHADGSEDDDARNLVQLLSFTPGNSGGSFDIFDEVTTNAAGVALFDLTFAESPDVATIIRATVTDPSGNTSQFSLPAVVQQDTTGVGVPDDDQNGNSPSPSNVTFEDARQTGVYINMQTSVGSFDNVGRSPTLTQTTPMVLLPTRSSASDSSLSASMTCPRRLPRFSDDHTAPGDTNAYQLLARTAQRKTTWISVWTAR